MSIKTCGNCLGMENVKADRKMHCFSRKHQHTLKSRSFIQYSISLFDSWKVVNVENADENIKYC